MLEAFQQEDLAGSPTAPGWLLSLEAVCSGVLPWQSHCPVPTPYKCLSSVALRKLVPHPPLTKVLTVVLGGGQPQPGAAGRAPALGRSGLRTRGPGRGTGRPTRDREPSGLHRAQVKPGPCLGPGSSSVFCGCHSDFSPNGAASNRDVCSPRADV